MSLERIIKALEYLGLSRADAKVYVYIANHGQSKAEVIAKALKLNELKTYASLRNLKKKGLITENGLSFSSLPFEEALELLIKQEKEKTQALEEGTKELAN